MNTGTDRSDKIDQVTSDGASAENRCRIQLRLAVKYKNVAGRWIAMTAKALLLAHHDTFHLDIHQFF